MTQQSGALKGLTSDRGVDGILGASGNDGNADCAHPDNGHGQAAWFNVHLGSMHQIYNVTVFNSLINGGDNNCTQLRLIIRIQLFQCTDDCNNFLLELDKVQTSAHMKTAHFMKMKLNLAKASLWSVKHRVGSLAFKEREAGKLIL